jgi:hypothetical protein
MRRAAAFALVTGVVLVSTLTLAQTRGTTPPHHHHPTPKPKAADSGASSQGEATAAPAHEPEAHASDAGAAIEARTLDGGTRVFRFGEVEIEGRLRNPQLVYFLRRVRAEFAAGELGHRSFMREMSETRKEPSF